MCFVLSGTNVLPTSFLCLNCLLFVDDVLLVLVVVVGAMFLGGRIVSIFVVFLDQIRGRSHRMRQRDASG